MLTSNKVKAVTQSNARWVSSLQLFAFASALLVLLGSCDQSSKIAEISIVDLIVRPENHRGKQVVTEGFFAIHEQARLYVSREDALYQLKTNSIIIADESLNHLESLQACTQSYVQVLATFNQAFSLEAIQSIKTHDLKNTLMTSCWEKPS